MTEKITIFCGGVGRYLVSELLELLLGATSLGDCEHVEVHGLAQGQHSPTVTVSPMGTSLKWGQVH